jgi:tetratricopeptide (TPR) repeat protein
MKTYKYLWKINNREIVGVKDCQSRDALKEHISNVGGELIEILSEVDKPMPPPPEAMKQELAPQETAAETKSYPGSAHDSSLKLYPLREINAAILLGGPLAGFYLVSRNFKNFQQHELSRKYLIIGVIVTILLFGSITLIPQGILKYVKPLILLYVPVLMVYFNKIQGRDLNAHFKNGGKKYSGWKALGVVLSALAISLAVFFVLSSVNIFLGEIHIQRVVDQAIKYGKIGNYNEAILRFNKALKLSPDNAGLYYNRGIAYSAAGNYDLAVADFTRFIELEPKEASAYKLRATAYTGIRNYEAVISDCTKAIQLDPNDAKVFETRAYAYYKKEDYDKAILDYTRSIQINPGNPEIYYSRAMMYNIRGDYDQAVVDCTKSLELDSRNAVVYSLRANAHASKGNYDQAIIDSTKVIELNPRDAQAYFIRGSAAAYKGAYDQAIEDYNKAIGLAPEQDVLYMARAVAYFHKTEYDKAWLDVHRVESLKGAVDAEFLEELKKASGREK